MSSAKEMKAIKADVQSYYEYGFKAIRCKGYDKKYNPENDYKTSKEPVDSGFTNDDFSGLTLLEIESWEKAGGWIGWLIPKGLIILDVENSETISYIKSLCNKLKIITPQHKTNSGKHFFFRTNKQLTGASEVFTKSGVTVTYRMGGKNYLILSPTNNRSWETALSDKLPELPSELFPCDHKNPDELLNVLSWQIGSAYRNKLLHGYV